MHLTQFYDEITILLQEECPFVVCNNIVLETNQCSHSSSAAFHSHIFTVLYWLCESCPQNLCKHFWLSAKVYYGLICNECHYRANLVPQKGFLSIGWICMRFQLFTAFFNQDASICSFRYRRAYAAQLRTHWPRRLRQGSSFRFGT